MRKIFAVVLAVLFMMVGGAAFADEGADAPTPYQVTTVGVHLPAGDTFRDGGHINARFFDPSGVQQSVNVHMEAKCIDRTDAECAGDRHEHAQFIGESFIPWSAFGITEGSRITWVQVHGYNQHFGEGGQKPVPVGPKPEPGEETREREDVAEREVPQCPTDEAGYGTVTTIRETFRVTEERTSTIEWDGADWIEVWSDWTEIDREVVSTETVQVREMTDAEYAECGMPPTGAGQVVGLAGIALLTLIGGTYLVRRSKA